MRYRVQVAGWALIWSGVLIFGYLGWQLWVTDWLNSGVQAQASAELSVELEQAQPEPQEIDPAEFLDEEAEEEEPSLPDAIEYFFERPVEVGEPFAFLSIPAIGLDEVVVYEGVDRDTLQSGPGHMQTTPLPGQPGNAVISGHRTTYGRPFFDFDLLEEGDTVEVETAVGTHVYEIRDVIVVEPTDVWVTDPRDGGWLTMTTCEPKFSARQRLVVFAEMVAGPNHDYIELAEIASGL